MLAGAVLKLKIDELRNWAQKDEHKSGGDSDNSALEREGDASGVCGQPEMGTIPEPGEHKAGHQVRGDKIAVLAHAEKGVADRVEKQGVHVERIAYAAGMKR